MKYRSDPPANGDQNSSLTKTPTASFGGAAAATPRHKSKSGIFDFTSTTDVKSPVGLFGSRAAASTQQNARLNYQSDSMRADLFRALFAAFAVPVAAALIFLEYGDGSRLQLGVFTSASNRFLGTNFTSRKTLARSPASVLPEVMPRTPVVPPRGAEISETIFPSDDTNPHPFALTLDSGGRLVQPFALELDENGFEISHLDAVDHLAMRPPILPEEFRSVTSIRNFIAPTTFRAITGAHPFLYSASERSRVIQLRDSVPEIQKMLSLSSLAVSERLRISPLATESFREPPGSATKSKMGDVLRDLNWVRAATTVANISGDSQIEKRILETLVLWAKTYRPSGFATVDHPLFDLLYGYDFIRPSLEPKDRKNLDDFFRDVVDRQFSQVRAMKEYDVEHAMHTLFAVTVGFVTEDAALQNYATMQYQAHLQNTSIYTEPTIGPGEVETLRSLLQAAFVMERSGFTGYRNENFDRLLTMLVENSPDDPMMTNTLALASYFRPELGTRRTKSATLAPLSLESTNIAILSTLRKPALNLRPDGVTVRTPASIPQRPALKSKR